MIKHDFTKFQVHVLVFHKSGKQLILISNLSKKINTNIELYIITSTSPKGTTVWVAHEKVGHGPLVVSY